MQDQRGIGEKKEARLFFLCCAEQQLKCAKSRRVRDGNRAWAPDHVRCSGEKNEEGVPRAASPLAAARAGYPARGAGKKGARSSRQPPGTAAGWRSARGPESLRSLIRTLFHGLRHRACHPGLRDRDRALHANLDGGRPRLVDLREVVEAQRIEHQLVLEEELQGLVGHVEPA